MESKPDSNKGDQEYVYDYDSTMTTKFHGGRTAERQAAWFLPYLEPDMMLLDCGCGSGSITIGLARAVEPGQVTGVDISKIEIERGQERAVDNKISNIRFEVGSAYQLDFPDKSFDALFSHNVLEHLSAPDKALKEMHRVLKPSGIIGIRDLDWGGLLVDPANEYMEKALEVWAAEFEKGERGNARIGRHLGGLLHEAGFVEVKMSALYEVYADPESRRSLVQNVVTRFIEPSFLERVVGYGLVTAEEMKAAYNGYLSWQETPGAMEAISHCEAIGRKAS